MEVMELKLNEWMPHHLGKSKLFLCKRMNLYSDVINARGIQKNFFALSKKLLETGSCGSPIRCAYSSSFLRCSALRAVGTSTCTRTSKSPLVSRCRKLGMP